MAGIVAKFGQTNLPISFTAAEAVTGGQLVERRNGTRQVGPAAAGSFKVVGVAKNDNPAARTSISGQQAGEENALTVLRQCVAPVQYAASAVAGDKLIAAANGQVTPAGVNPDSRSVIGECFDTTASGQVGQAYIY